MMGVFQMGKGRGYEDDDQVGPNCPVLVPTGEYIACQFISVLSRPIRSKNFDILSFIFGSTDSIAASEEVRSLYFFVSMKTLGGIYILALGLNIFDEESMDGEEGMFKTGSLAGSREGLLAIQPFGRQFWTMLITQSMAALMSFCNFFISLLILSLNLMYSNLMSCKNSIESWLTFMGLFLGDRHSQDEIKLGRRFSQGWTYGVGGVLMAVGL